MDHWWWDTSAPNDGGVMFDTSLRAFMELHFKSPVSMADRFTVTSLNPATFGPKHGIKVLKLSSAGK